MYCKIEEIGELSVIELFDITIVIVFSDVSLNHSVIQRWSTISDYP